MSTKAANTMLLLKSTIKEVETPWMAPGRISQEYPPGRDPSRPPIRGSMFGFSLSLSQTPGASRRLAPARTGGWKPDPAALRPLGLSRDRLPEQSSTDRGNISYFISNNSLLVSLSQPRFSPWIMFSTLASFQESCYHIFSARRIGHGLRATRAPRPGKTEGPGRRLCLAFPCPLSVTTRVNEPAGRALHGLSRR